MKVMDILLATDNNFTLPTGVLMTSISLNSGELVRYHILVDDAFTAENREKLLREAEHFGNEAHFYCISADQLKQFPIGREDMPGHVSLSAYNRLFVTEFLPADVHKILYLDGDITVRKSLKPLWDEDLTGLALGVVHDMSEKGHVDSGRLPYPAEYGYFNSGVLLINLDYWREHDCFNRFIDCVREDNAIIKMHDQDVLNFVLYAEKKWLPLTYNFQAGFLFDCPEMIEFTPDWNEEIRSIERDPVVIHYCGWSKPWNRACMHPQRFVWEYYKSKGTFRDAVYPEKLTLREKLSFFVRKNNFWFGEHHWDSVHRNIYRRVIIRK